MEIRRVPSRPTRTVLRGVARLLLWHKQIRDRFRSPARSRPPSRIALFASMELLGGGIIISAIAKSLKEVYPQAKISLIGERHRAGKLETFFTTHSWIDELIICPRRGSIEHGDASTPADWWGFYRELRKHRFDMCVLAPNHACSNSVFLYLCGVPEIVGADLPDTWTWHREIENRFLTRRVTTEQIGQPPYRLLYFPQAYARTLSGRNDYRISELVPYLRFRDEGLPPMLAHKPIVTLHPGGPPNKRWSPAGYAAIGRLLVQHYDAAVCIIGGKPEAEAAEQIRASIARDCPGGHVTNCCGSSMNETLTYVAHSALFVGNSAGPMHLAVGLGTPVVGVLLQKDRWFSGPDAAGSRHCTVARERLADVSVSEVWDAVQSQWRTVAVPVPSM